MMKDKLMVLSSIIKQGIIPVFYHKDKQVCLEVIHALVKGGAKCIEFTNRDDFSLSIFAEVRKYFSHSNPDIIFGVGSIVDAPTAALFIAHGANFIVGPNFNADIALLCNRRGMPYIGGCSSATEINNAQSFGCDIVKIFPGESVGGPEFVKAVLGPMPWSKIMPTGGVDITQDSLSQWFDAGIVAAGIGSKLITSEILKSQDFGTLENQMRILIDRVAKIKQKNNKVN